MDLLSLFKEQVLMLKRTLPESIVVQLDYNHEEYTVHADPTRMQQMMMNLAINAGHAMPDGGSLHIGLKRITYAQGATPLPLMEAGEWVQVTVADTGMGISPLVLPHIFDPFYTTKAPGEGTGLGLAQVHGIVSQHKGHIDVQSEVGVGTTFTIYLPRLAMQTLAHSTQKSMKPQGNGEMLLVVEDNPVLRSALVETLDSLNYHMLEAANGLEALALLTTHGNEIAMVLSDVVMPKMGESPCSMH
ncbi:MAG: response regulator [bacterium]|nr:response regulator [bacterium]